MKINIVMFLLLGMFLISFASASTETYQLNKDVQLKFLCTLNNAIPSAGALYNFTLSYPNGTTFITDEATALGNGAFYYNLSFPLTGIYKVHSFCWDGSYSYSNPEEVEVTYTGESYNLSKTILYVVFLLVLIIFFIYSISKAVTIDNYGWGLGLTSIAYLLFICLTFIAWQISLSFLVSIEFISTILYFIFYLSLIGFLPFFFIMIMYLLYKMADEKQIGKMVDMGHSREDAEKSVRRR